MSLFDIDKQRLERIKQQTIDQCTKCNGSGRIIAHEERQVKLSMCECSRLFNELVLFAQTNIPEKYWPLSLKESVPQKFSRENQQSLKILRRYIKKMPEMIRQGIGLYIQGPVGTGKSFLACEVLKTALRSGHTGYFTSLSELVSLFFRTSRDTVAQDLLRRITRETDLLVIDQISTSEMERADAVEKLIRERYYTGKPYIATSTLSIQGLEEVEKGYSVADMFIETLIPVPFESDRSFRKDLGEKLLEKLNE